MRSTIGPAVRRAARPVEATLPPDPPREAGAGEQEALVSCHPLSAFFEELTRRGHDPRRLLAGVDVALEHLLDRGERVPWRTVHAVLENAARVWSEDELVRFGRGLVGTKAQRPFNLIARYLYSVADSYRAVFTPRTGYGPGMFPCMDTTFVQLAADGFEATIVFKEGFEPSPACFAIIRGSLIALPQILGCPPAEVRAVPLARGVRFEIRAAGRVGRLARLRGRLSLLFRAHEVAAELREAHASLHSRWEALHEALRQRERAERVLRESDGRLRLMLESVEMSIWEWNVLEDVLVVDERGRRLVGLEGIEIRGAFEKFLARVHPDDREHVAAEVGRSLEHGGTVHQRFRVLSLEGEWRTADSRAHVFLAEDGRPLRMVGVVQDLTEQLRTTERQLHLGRVIESSPSEIYVVDAHSLRFLEVNRCARQNLGYSMLELREMTPVDIAEDLDPAHVAAILAPLKSGERDRLFVSARHRRKDGTHYPVELTLQGSTFDSAPAFYAIAIDVTERERGREERERLELQLRHAQKVEALGTLASGIAHDFNNILLAIIGYGELAQEAIGADTRAHGYLAQVLKASARGKQLARQILTFSRTPEHPRRPTDMATVVRESLDLMKATLPTTIEIRARLNGHGCRAKADAGQVHQVVMNLCTNAAHAMEPDGGVLEVSLERVELPAADAAQGTGPAAGTYVRLTVRDEGCGMSPEVQRRIFDPFFTTKEVDRGTGLGLAVVHGIVRAHEGSIEVESQRGTGTTLRVLFPCVEEVAAEEERPATAPARGSGRILVVDDEPALATLLEMHLVELGYEVEAFTDSTLALGAFLREPARYDVVLTDQTMPSMTGTSLAERIHALRPGLPVVLISGLGAPRQPESLESAGIVAVIPKPFRMDELGATLARITATVPA